MTEQPGSVLFACNYNSVRSPMAEGLAKALYGKRFFIDSAGVRPGGELDGFSVAVMAEIGIDISGHEPKTFDDLNDTSFDLVITLTPQAQHSAIEMTRTMAVDIEYWPTLDPTATLGSRDVILAAYRQVRDALRQQLEARFGPPSGTNSPA
jgi:protein-tyrosine-phosphatase